MSVFFMSRTRWLAAMAGVMALAPVLALAQQRVGSEFVVNAYTPGAQGNPHVASHADGTFIVVWAGAGVGDSSGVFARLYDAAGTPVGGDLLVNSYVAGTQSAPAAAATADGEFVVAWSSFGQDGSSAGVFARRVSGAGALLGTEFQVNAYTPGDQRRPSVAGSPAGFVVTWDSQGQDGQNEGVFGQCYTPAGIAVGGEFQVNTYTTQYQYFSSVGMNQSGHFAVVWSEHPRRRTFGQRYAADCSRVGSEFQAHFGLLGTVGLDAAGAFVVAGLASDGHIYGVAVQRFSSGGTAVGNQFLVNQYTTNVQDFPEIAVAPSGDFVVTWQTYNLNTFAFDDISARAYRSDGAPLTPEFIVNTYTIGPQSSPRVGIDGNARFVVVWMSPSDGSSFGVAAQRFGSLDLIFADGFDSEN
jgi:hypothetical protein